MNKNKWILILILMSIVIECLLGIWVIDLQRQIDSIKTTVDNCKGDVLWMKELLGKRNAIDYSKD